MFSQICFTIFFFINFSQLEHLKRIFLIIKNSFSQFTSWKRNYNKYSYIWNSRFVKTSNEFVIKWNEIEMGRVPKCERMLVQKTNQIMTKISKPLTDLPICKWVVVFLTCSCLNILTNSIIIIKNWKKYHSPRAMYYKKSWIIIEIKIQT